MNSPRCLDCRSYMVSDYDEGVGPFWRCDDCSCAFHFESPHTYLKLHKQLEIHWRWPWQTSNVRSWFFWKSWERFHEREYRFVQFLGMEIRYSWQPMSDGQAEELRQFIRDEQSAGETWDDYEPQILSDDYEDEQG